MGDVEPTESTAFSGVIAGVRRQLAGGLRSQLRRNMVSGVVATSVFALVTLISYPVYLRFLGYELFGVWLVLATLISVAQVCSLGVGPAVTRLVAEEIGAGVEDAVAPYVTMASALVALTGAILVGISWFFADQILAAFDLEGEFHVIGRQLLPIVGMLTVYVFLVQVLSAALSGVGRIDQVNYRDCVCRVIGFLVSIACLWRGMGVVSLVVGTFAATASMHLASLHMLRRYTGGPLFHRAGCTGSRARRLLKTGVTVLGSSVVNMLVSPFNKLAISRIVGVGFVPVYEIAFNSSMQVRSLFESGFRALMPEISREAARADGGGSHRVSRVYLKSVGLVLTLGALVYVVAAVLAPWVLRAWLRARFVPELVPAFRLMLLASYLSLCGVPAYYRLLGEGRVRICFLADLVQSVLNVAAVGILAVAMASLMTTGVFWAAVIAYAGGTVVLTLAVRLRGRDARPDEGLT